MKPGIEFMSASFIKSLAVAIGVVVARITAGELDFGNIVNAFKGRSTS